MEARFVRTLVLFFVFTVVFGILEHSKFRRGLRVDILCWFFTLMVSQVLVMIAAAIALLPLYLMLSRLLDLNSILASYGSVARLLL